MKMMYRKNKAERTKMRINDSTIGESIEEKMRRLLRDKEPIKDLAPQVYTERKDGVRPEYDIRTDKWEVATEARDKIAEERTTLKKAKDEGKVVKLDEKGKKIITDKQATGDEGTGTEGK